MKVLISDYEDSMMPSHELEIETLRLGLGENVEIEVYPYQDNKRDEFFQKLRDVDALLTAFVKIDKEALDHAKNLKIISLNSTGFDKVDLEEANRRKIGVSPVGEYCTWDVSESALAYALALNKGLKHYDQEIQQDHKWDYASLSPNPRLENSIIGIFGFGKIGQCTARKFKGLAKEILAYDLFDKSKEATEIGVEMTMPDDIYRRADIIINHMNLTDQNRNFFNKKAFAKMEKKPIFINLARGLQVDEEALVQALNEGVIRGAGLDVLADEKPDLKNHPLVGRDNVILTPHSSFYSVDSITDLERISSQNIVYFIKGEYDKIFKLVNAEMFGINAE